VGADVASDLDRRSRSGRTSASRLIRASGPGGPDACSRPNACVELPRSARSLPLAERRSGARALRRQSARPDRARSAVQRTSAFAQRQASAIRSGACPPGTSRKWGDVVLYRPSALAWRCSSTTFRLPFWGRAIAPPSRRPRVPLCQVKRQCRATVVRACSTDNARAASKRPGPPKRKCDQPASWLSHLGKRDSACAGSRTPAFLIERHADAAEVARGSREWKGREVRAFAR
jgi:hypothetical protein